MEAGPTCYCLGRHVTPRWNNFWANHLNASRRIWNYSRPRQLPASQSTTSTTTTTPFTTVAHLSTCQSTPQIAPYAFSLIPNPSSRRVCDRDDRPVPGPSSTTNPTPWHMLQLRLKDLSQAHTLLHLQLLDSLLVLLLANHCSLKAGAHQLQVPIRTMAIRTPNRARHPLQLP